MNTAILLKSYPPPPFCEREILRYAGCKTADEKTERLLKDCIKQAEMVLSYTVCYRELEVKISDNICDFGAFRCISEKLAINLKGCNKVILFAATVGMGIDRLILRHSRLSPSKALFFQAIGAERIEALCDTFCEDMSGKAGLALKPRFSPGYGDLELNVQRDIFSVLECSKKIGLSLNESLLMSPSKSVTAIIGICG